MDRALARKEPDPEPDLGFKFTPSPEGTLITLGEKNFHIMAAPERTPYCKNAEIFFVWALTAQANTAIARTNAFSEVKEGETVQMFLRDEETLEIETIILEATIGVKKMDYPTGIILEPKSMAGLICTPDGTGGWTVVRPFQLKNVNTPKAQGCATQRFSREVLDLKTDRNTQKTPAGKRVTLTRKESAAHFSETDIEVVESNSTTKILLKNAETLKNGQVFWVQANTSDCQWNDLGESSHFNPNGETMTLHRGTIQREGQDTYLLLATPLDEPLKASQKLRKLRGGEVFELRSETGGEAMAAIN